jgi:hypothetical protein
MSSTGLPERVIVLANFSTIMSSVDILLTDESQLKKTMAHKKQK